MEIKRLKLLGVTAEKTISIGSGGVIIRNNQVLLVRGKGGTQFKFPGGHIDDSENFQQSAAREAMEEIGCSVRTFGEPIFYSLDLNESLQIILIHYLAEIISGAPKPLTEIEEIQWFDIYNLPNNLFPNVKPVIESFTKLPNNYA